MVDRSAQDDFVLTISDVFELTGRGIVVSGPIESGVVRTGDRVRVDRGDATVATSEVDVEFLDKRDGDGSIALVLRNLEGERPEPGDVVIGPATSSEPK